MQLVFDDAEFHHGVGTEHGRAEREARIVGAAVLAAELLGHHLGPHAGAAQLRQLFRLGVGAGAAHAQRVVVVVVVRAVVAVQVDEPVRNPRFPLD